MMSRCAVTIVLALATLSVPQLTWAQAPAAATPVMQAFDEYEAIRVQLAGDKFDNVSRHATALAPLAGRVAGKNAQAAASRLASSKTLAAARTEFVSLSTELVPKFLEAKLPGVHGFMCPMKDSGTWAQRSDKIENPYFGKAMLNCGTEIKTASR
jgi:hypothetical protein